MPGGGLAECRVQLLPPEPPAHSRTAAPPSPSAAWCGRSFAAFVLRELVLARGGLPLLGLASLAVLYTLLISQVGAVAGQCYSLFIDGNSDQLWPVLARSCALYAAAAAVSGTQSFLKELLALQWRVLLTRRLQRAYCHGSGSGAQKDAAAAALPPPFLWAPSRLDNPDQRIAQDLPQFCSSLAQALVAMVAVPATVTWYTWLVYRTFGTWQPVAAAGCFFVTGALAQRSAVGAAARLVFDLERREGDLRAAHARLRAQAESISQSRGQAAEHAHLAQAFDAVAAAQWRLALLRWLLAALAACLEYAGAQRQRRHCGGCSCRNKQETSAAATGMVRIRSETFFPAAGAGSNRRPQPRRGDGDHPSCVLTQHRVSGSILHCDRAEAAAPRPTLL